MRYESLEDKGRLGEGFLLMLRYMFQQHKIQKDDTEWDRPEQHSGHHPCVGFLYFYLHYFNPCVGLILLHFLMAPAWVCLYVYFPLSNTLLIIKHYFGGNHLFGLNSHVHHSNALGLPLAQKGPHA